MPIIGLDVGEKRIGVAESDELNFMAYAAGFIERKTDEFAIREIEKLLTASRIDSIVVGLPTTLKGDVGRSAEKILSFVDQLRKHLNCPVNTWDERLTTVEATRRLLAHDVSRRERRQKVDALAAEIMLQSYLDYLKMKPASEKN